MKTLLFAILFVTSCAARAEPWDKSDKLLGGLALGATLIDWGQSRYIAKHPEYVETNAMLGPNPTLGRVNTYFASIIILEGIAAHLLPSAFRKGLLGGTALLEINVITKNYAFGVKVEF